MRLLGCLVALGLTLATGIAEAQAPPGVGPTPALPGPGYGPPSGGFPIAPPSYGAALPPTGDEGSNSPAMAGWASALSTFLPISAGFVLIGARPDRDEGAYVFSGVTLISLGAVVGPGVGHMYAGEAGHGWGFAGLRLASFGLAIGNSFLGLAAGFGGSPGLAVVGLGFGGTASAVGVGLMFYDLMDAPDAARRSNRQEAAAERFGMPELTIEPGGGALRWTF